jgi:L-alanine-DL-glutamate epimerase-like enolase superfamily enzyme
MGATPFYDVLVSPIYFDSDEDAIKLAAALETEGYTTSLRREGFAGEDDSDDRAWVLVAEPFDHRVVEMVDAYGGWMPRDDRPAAPAPVELPQGPKRLKS